MHKHAFSAAVAAKIAEAGRKFDEVHKSLVLCNDINEDKISIVMKNNGFFQNRTPLMKNRRAVSKVNEDMGIASRLNLQGTPSFVLCKIDKSVWLLPKVLDQIDSVLKK